MTNEENDLPEAARKFLTEHEYQLYRYAKQATPGPWRVIGEEDLPKGIDDLMLVSDAILDDGVRGWITNLHSPGGDQSGPISPLTISSRNARYLASVDPDTVNELLMCLIVSRREVAKMKPAYVDRLGDLDWIPVPEANPYKEVLLNLLTWVRTTGDLSEPWVKLEREITDRLVRV